MNNLIGISGRMGSGKDLCGQIIQFLTMPEFGYTKCPHWNFHFNKNNIPITNRHLTSEYKIVKFADKLKNMVCMLIGCTREQLESQGFKSRELSSLWDYYFCDSSITNKMLTLSEYNNLSNNQKEYFELKHMTPRLLLQLLGTQCGREIIHPNIWVNSLFNDYIPDLSGYSDRMTKEDMKELYPKWIITDVRFPNEVKVIKENGGIVIRINRPCISCGQVNFHKMDCGYNTSHESETALDNYTGFDHVIFNGSSIDDLINTLKSVLEL